MESSKALGGVRQPTARGLRRPPQRGAQLANRENPAFLFNLVLELVRGRGLYAHGLQTDTSLLLEPRADHANDGGNVVREKVIDRSIELETMLFALVGRIDEIEQICRKHRLLSPRSTAALSKLKRGQTNLARSELNAMSNLIERLRDVGVDLTEIAGAE